MFLIRLFQFVLLAFLCNLSLEAANPSLIFISGASCSGKSTLSKALAKQLDNDWVVIDRDAIAEYEPDEDKVDRILIDQIRDNQNLSVKTIVDTQSYKILVETFQEEQPFTILVYAPLSKLIERDLARQQVIQRTERRMRYARAFVYQTYAALITLDQIDSRSCIDFISPGDIDASFKCLPLEVETFTFLQFLQNLTESTPIYAAQACDVIVRSDMESVADAGHRITEQFAIRN